MTWSDDDALWEMTEPAMFTSERIANAPQEVDHLIELLRIKPPARVLDMCTGPGRHAIELAKRGFAVTGVDRTARYLERARIDAAEARVEVELIRGDARNFTREGAFDAALCLFTSFGFFDDEDNRTVLRNLAASLRPGGAAIIDVNGKEVLARRFQPRSWSEGGGVFILEDRKIRSDWSHVDARWIVFRDGVRRDFDITVRVYSGLELKSELLQCGFERVNLYGALTGAEYDVDAQRLIAIARR